MIGAAFRCPICRRKADPDYRPFCSKRCADVDLAQWLSGSYAIPAEEDELPSQDEGNGPRQ